MEKEQYLVKFSGDLTDYINSSEKNGEKFWVDYDMWRDFLAFRITIPEGKSFLQIKETLSRMGVPGVHKEGESPTLFQTCHILQKKNNFYIVHFKELLILDGKSINLSWNDLRRRLSIIMRLYSWGLIDMTLKDAEYYSTRRDDYEKVSLKTVRYAEKDKWNFVTKYTIGSKNTEKRNEQ